MDFSLKVRYGTWDWGRELEGEGEGKKSKTGSVGLSSRPESWVLDDNDDDKIDDDEEQHFIRNFNFEGEFESDSDEKLKFELIVGFYKEGPIIVIVD